MCAIYFAFREHPKYPLILLANRDEFYDRPAAPANYWKDFPNIYGGRDLVGSGTWLGVTKSGRFAAVTNYRDPSAPTGTRSRGNLVADFLKGNDPAEAYLKAVRSNAKQYSGFNLLVGQINSEISELFYYSNRGDQIVEVATGIHGLSNRLLDTPWPKVENGKARFSDLLAQVFPAKKDFFELLRDETTAPDDELPSTGIPYEQEKALSAIFIKTPNYGTRCSTVLTFDKKHEWDFEERVFV